MYEAIQLSFNNLENPSISKDNILFLGFDDAVLSGYARYLVEQKQELTPIKTDDGFIGHLPMIEHYNKMLEKWEDIESKKKLSEKEIKQLLKAGLSNFFGL